MKHPTPSNEPAWSDFDCGLLNAIVSAGGLRIPVPSEGKKDCNTNYQGLRYDVPIPSHRLDAQSSNQSDVTRKVCGDLLTDIAGMN